MAKQFVALTPAHREFIARQRVFFTGSAAATGRVNVSPKGLDCLRVLGDNRICYLDRTGSGNETSAHLRAAGRLTVMLCAFEGPPLILRLYGAGRVVAHGTPEYAALLAEHFGDEPPGARQFVLLDIDMVQTSCGYAVPLMSYEGDRPTLDRWAESKGQAGIEAYWREKNRASIDGFPTGMFDEANTAAE